MAAWLRALKNGLKSLDNWISQLSYDPIPTLVSCGNTALTYLVGRDLLGVPVEPIETLWQLPEALQILKKQLPDGSWKYPGGHANPAEDYDQLETFRQLGFLVEFYGFTNQHPAVQKAAEFLFSNQTPEGDFRGIMGTQYVPHYSAGIMELLVKAGYAQNTRIHKGFEWLLSMRQDDGGWAFPIRTTRTSYSDSQKCPFPIQPDRSKPFSHLLTGVVLRAFSAHPFYRHSETARRAGELLASRFFKADKYIDRRTASYWESVSFPFWFTDIVSALDSLSFLGFTRQNHQLNLALDWLKNRQIGTGIFDLKLLKNSCKDLSYWVAYAICRILKRLW